MDRKDNIKQAMYELFGVGAKPEIEINDVDSPKKEVSDKVEQTVKKVIEKKAMEKKAAEPAAPVEIKKAAVSYLAAGTSLEGTLRAKGDVEISGEFKGDIFTDGAVILRSSIQGNISANSLTLYGCTLTGDANVERIVTVDKNSVVCGNITTKELLCAGKINGDLKLSDNATLENTAHISGNIVTGTISVAKGAILKGTIEIA